MPRLTDKALIRARLELDRPWSVYALGDLAPEHWDASEWYGSDGDSDAVALLYRAAHPPILLTTGDPVALTEALRALPPEPVLMLSIRPEALDPIRRRWNIPAPTPMWRMLLAQEPPLLDESGGAERLEPASLTAIQELFEDGREAGEAPDYFLPSMLNSGVYFGILEGEELVAAAGTHLTAPQEDVATIGNVYTRRDRRGRGLARRVTGAVARELLRQGFGTIALNVRQSNTTAITLYESLGFRKFCPFYEGLAYLASLPGTEQGELASE